MSKIIGKCWFKKCESKCCRQFRLYYEKGTLQLPQKKKQKQFKYPQEMFENIINKNKEVLSLFAWRGITYYTEDGELFINFPRQQIWKFYEGVDHDILILPEVACRYLRKDGSCKIHQRKPSICKDFPRGIDEIPEGCTYSISPECQPVNVQENCTTFAKGRTEDRKDGK